MSKAVTPTRAPTPKQAASTERCGAKTRDGDPCKNAKVTGATRCRMHGGTQPKGFLSPNTKDGRYSRYLRGRMKAAYEESLSDPDRMSVAEEISAIDGRIRDVMARANGGESGETWAQMRATWRAFKSAQDRGEAATMLRMIAEISTLMDAGLAEQQAWVEITALIEQRRKLVETEHKRRVAGYTTITIEHLEMILATLARSVKENVKDPEAVKNISRAMGAVLNGGVVR